MKTILYGMNHITELLIKEYDSTVIVTTDGQQTHPDCSIISLKELENQDFACFDTLVICSVFVDEITESLLSIQFPLEKIHFYRPSSMTIEPVKQHMIPQVDESKVLYAFYDLAKNNAAFDADKFTVFAEMERQKRQMETIHFVIIPKFSKQERQVHIESIYSQEAIQWRLDQIVSPLFKCLPTTSSVSQLTFREEAEAFYTRLSDKQIFPAENDNVIMFTDINQHIEQGYSCNVMKAPTQAHQLVENFIESYSQGRKLIVVTLREYDSQTDRNNNMAHWDKFLRQLDQALYCPVIIRDTYNLLTPSPLPDYLHLDIAASNLHIRAALYERAYLNLSVSCGPAGLFYYLQSCYAIQILPIDENIPTISPQTYRRCGYDVYQQPLIATPGKQYIKWGDDTFENICAAFNEFEAARCQIEDEAKT
ncbi:hypothetical protein A7985_08465 [Pseudoalteromonas luteoviolacea]|uniref:Uncharacterized protein n=1 Tax=Pseudoalteromonas luteoviolacea TaxID=43657 RepID=A0A1C0TXI9_9GAMM|nr:hypothetical protein [Pseudoalteromonas luteoviolacea]MBQ4810466.1 hypothetical protein [Pseudoalteromonas luteoviolacea]OCQ23954.1 hypothetical protein A7985_08465 [Pseudoalteromonas luteoviolacea]